VLLNHLLHEGQPEAGAALLGRVEGVEDPPQVLRRDAAAGVAHQHLHRPLGPPRRHGEGAAAGHGLAGVAHQVEQHGPERPLVAPHRRQAARQLAPHLDPGRGQLRRQEVEQRTAELGEVLPPLRLARRAGEAQVLLGDGVEPVHLARDGGAEGPGLGGQLGAGLQLLGEELGVEADGVQGVADLMGDLGRDAPHRRQPLGPPQLPLLRGERGGHGVELAGQQADLVAALDLHLARQVAGGHRLDPLGEPADGGQQPPREEGRDHPDQQGDEGVDDDQRHGARLGPLGGVDPVGDAALQLGLQQLHLQREPLLELPHLLHPGLQGGARGGPLLQEVEQAAGGAVVLRPAGPQLIQPGLHLGEHLGVLLAAERPGLPGHPLALLELLPHQRREVGPGHRQVGPAGGRVQVLHLERPGRHPVLHLQLGGDAAEREVAVGEQLQVLPEGVQPHDRDRRHQAEGGQGDREGQDDLGRDAAHGEFGRGAHPTASQAAGCWGT
jgi:hypothetical protein